ncbi:uncharacterized protein TNCT_692221 [Trichonephila clavata]|uniref:Uncharacterized protein n=1 Tax=Trichonephila clavata TaxID=2740835 RepID=A0A8X6HYA0_TRICU|nr:uncharacterized protein TNCT_692221 [Trichonephila clavata]
MGDSPFFIMTAGEMSSLQQQYEPAHASPLRATTAQTFEKQDTTTTVITTTEQTTVTQTPPTTTTQTATVTSSDSSVPHTEPTTTTTKCLSFRNQLSLVLSTEDNIDNSLLKRHILPTQDCNNSDEETVNTFARLQSIDTTVTEDSVTTQSTTLPTTTQAPTTSPRTESNLVPYLSSRLSNNPSKPDVVVVTSLPVLIDLKNSRNRPVTDVPTWKEVTVGVVRDQQGQPLKPRYNNWTAHLRGLKKKPENKFWNELTTPGPDFKSHQRLPNQQNFQQSPSQVNHAFWTDLQRQRPPVVQNSREKNIRNPPPYITNPPQNFLHRTRTPSKSGGIRDIILIIGGMTTPIPICFQCMILEGRKQYEILITRLNIKKLDNPNSGTTLKDSCHEDGRNSVQPLDLNVVPAHPVRMSLT